MARLNIDILEISELKWTGLGEFNSDNNYIYYCGQESLRRKGEALTVNKRVWNAMLGCNLKNDRMISVPFQGKPFNIRAYTVIQVYSPSAPNWKASWSLRAFGRRGIPLGHFYCTTVFSTSVQQHFPWTKNKISNSHQLGKEIWVIFPSGKTPIFLPTPSATCLPYPIPIK